MTPFSLLSVWNRLRSTYWFVPSLMTAAAVALALLLIALDRSDFELPAGVWLYTGGADGAQGLLSAVAGSMITVVSVTFSVTVVALTVSSQHFGPRLLNSFMRDTAAQLVLGTFIGTFAYCVLVLRTVHGEGDGYGTFVPHVAVTGAVVLTLLSVAMLIYYVHHVSSTLQVSEITRRVAADLEAAIDRIYPEAIGDAGPARPPLPVPDDGFEVGAAVAGYVQEVDAEELLRVATEADVAVWVTADPGAFVLADTPLALVFPAPGNRDQVARQLQRAFVVGADRTPRQDAAFAVRQLVEVAMHALSPGINEPYTAITCIDRIGQGLARMAARALPAAHRKGADGRVRVIARPRTFADLLDEAVIPLRVYAGPNPAIGERILAMLALIAPLAQRAEDLTALRGSMDATCEACLVAIQQPVDRERLLAAHARAIASLSSGRPPDRTLQ